MGVTLVRLLRLEKNKAFIAEELFGAIFRVMSLQFFIRDKFFLTFFTFIMQVQQTIFRLEVSGQMIFITKIHNTSITTKLFFHMMGLNVSLEILFKL